MAKWSTPALGAALALACGGWPGPAGAESRHPHGHPAAHGHAHGHLYAAAHAHRARGHRTAALHPGRVQKGKAWVCAAGLRGREMADGTRFDPGSDAAASETLPPGTAARATDLRNGRAATVRVRDRGPHRAGRILDVSPQSAGALGMGRDGVAPVAVVPLAPPPEARIE